MSYHPNAERKQRAAAIIEARKGNGPPELVASVQARDKKVAVLAHCARKRRYAMKLQQKIDRAMESHIRLNYTEWNADASEEERKKFNAQVADLIEKARAINLEIEKAKDDQRAIEALVSASDFDRNLLDIVRVTDRSRLPVDEQREQTEAEMVQFGAQLHVASWIEPINGAGIKGLTLIVAEAGSLDNYPNPQKLWKRLGYAPYDGRAGSTWKREKWRPRKLTADEWVANPFSGERYAAMFNIGESMVIKHQWISAKKNGGEEGRPNGRYGEIYWARRQHTKETHPEWTKGHSKADGVRVAMKQFLVDLWEVWVDRSYDLGHIIDDAHVCPAETAAAGQSSTDAHLAVARGGTKSKKRNGHDRADAQRNDAVPATAGHHSGDAHHESARGGTRSKRNSHTAADARKLRAVPTAAGQDRHDAHKQSARGGAKSSKRNGQLGADAQRRRAVPAAAGQTGNDAHVPTARGGTK